MHTASHYQQSYIPTRHPNPLIHLLYSQAGKTPHTHTFPSQQSIRKKSIATPSLSHHAAKNTPPRTDHPLQFLPNSSPIPPFNSSPPNPFPSNPIAHSPNQPSNHPTTPTPLYKISASAPQHDPNHLGRGGKKKPKLTD